jgi:hypothetical protein
MISRLSPSLSLLSLLLLLSTFPLLSQASSPTRTFLRLDQNRQVVVEPFQLQELYVPLESLAPSQTYWIRTYYSGAVITTIAYSFIFL